jgi:hypothetical protein
MINEMQRCLPFHKKKVLNTSQTQIIDAIAWSAKAKPYIRDDLKPIRKNHEEYFKCCFDVAIAIEYLMPFSKT